MKQVGAGPPLQKIIVRRGPARLEEVRRPLRRMPRGEYGAEYLGLVYPIDDAGQIDIDAAWCYPGQAPICLDPPSGDTRPGQKAWALESEGYRPYLFLAGSAQRLLCVIAELRAAGFGVDRWGVAFRPEYEHVYPWYIRFPNPSEGRPPSDWEIGQALATVDADGASEPYQPSGSAIDASPKQAVIDLERALAAEVQARDAAEARAAELRKEFRRELARANDAAAFLRAALATLERRLEAPRADEDAPSPDVAELREALQRLNGELQQALSEWLSVETERQAATTEIAELRARITELEGLVVVGAPSTPSSPGRLRSAARDLAATLSTFVPEIQLARDSADFIAQEVGDKTDLLKKFRLIVQDRPALKAKRVQNSHGWMEVHFSTGSARDGRLYFKKIETPGDAAWHVLVSDKGAQPRDFEWIAKQ